jgi:hypothetical protein
MVNIYGSKSTNKEKHMHFVDVKFAEFFRIERVSLPDVLVMNI